MIRDSKRSIFVLGLAAIILALTALIVCLLLKNRYDVYMDAYQQVVSGTGRMVELPEGGEIHYIFTDQESEASFDVTVTCLVRQQTLDYVLENFPKNMSKKELASVQAAEGFLQIVTLAQIKQGEPSGKPVSVITGWEQHTTYTVPTEGKALRIQEFA